ncbi:putative oxoglutarate/iron-dependent dioxygenase, non-heme dioxygenase domain-containing protein [Rosa chinensis]|uniref:Putative oxoglutarate/iron-dependent dioxygenase, non-heme dioxygenase domain-containing protein n=1 Tax=Rosa chinensis TaxID=74649 RepID=A0A2P6R4B2_ROSCH|nr:probable inactive 2-oxoglutarate-dependent dioxygenase AOP2 [Rosa chinensis]PRQ41254.1 putative oxoglutarate/iron-dependent dioxygenase, non-heme dioxygenase domain-containing protein [Rosa chinensis]
MGSMTLPKELPIINFSLLKPGTSSWASTCKQVRCALEEYGCFVALYQQVSPQLMDNIFGQSRDLFEVPLENKVRNTSEEPYRGYIGPNQLMPLYESVAIDNVTSPQETQKFRDLMWPYGKTNFCEITDLFAKLVGDLENTVGKMIFESFGIPQEQYESLASSNSHLLRFLKYRTPEESDTVIRFPSLTDKNFTSIVVQHDVGGLEVQTKDGDWISVESAPSLFLAADGLQVWSNDRMKACQHRVKNCGDKTRYSLGMFTFNNGVFQVPKELVDDSHPLLYNQFDGRGFIRFYTTKEAKKAKSPIKAYCGIKN